MLATALGPSPCQADTAPWGSPPLGTEHRGVGTGASAAARSGKNTALPESSAEGCVGLCPQLQTRAAQALLSSRERLDLESRPGTEPPVSLDSGSPGAVRVEEGPGSLALAGGRWARRPKGLIPRPQESAQGERWPPALSPGCLL